MQDAYGVENLGELELPRPVPGPNEVLVRMRAASLNFRDLLMIDGKYAPEQALPLIPCSDGVGETVQLGEGVSTRQVGERVCPLFAQGWVSGTPTRAMLRRTLGGPLDGVLAEYAVFPEAGVIPVPSYLSDVEAACLPCAALTAWGALFEHGRLAPNESLVTLGTGGVALFAAQFAIAHGAKVIALSSQEKKLERLATLGATAGLNYLEIPDWGRAVRRLTWGEGAEQIIEVGGAASLSQSLQAVKPGGTVSLIGVLGGTKAELDLLPILMRQIRVQGIFVGNRKSFTLMNEWLERTRVRPVVDKVFALDETSAALEYLRGGHHFGKVCIEID